jgi:hypothetical protein
MINAVLAQPLPSNRRVLSDEDRQRALARRRARTKRPNLHDTVRKQLAPNLKLDGFQLALNTYAHNAKQIELPLQVRLVLVDCIYFTILQPSYYMDINTRQKRRSTNTSR